MSKPYAPPYRLNSAIVHLVALIGEAIGRLSVQESSLRLRRINRIRSIQASLRIEDRGA